jgi:hypothetical protein
MGNDTIVKTRFTPFMQPPRVGPDGYDRRMPDKKPAPRAKGSGLRACPFCRELFTDDETDTCPECGLVVKDLAELPPSPEADALTADEAGRGIQATIPQAEMLPWLDMSRGRGPLLACALAGMAAFYYLPWASQTMPHVIDFTGVQLGHAQQFFWATFTAWLVLFPAVLSRRSILKMAGARPIVTVLSAAPALQCAFLLSRPTKMQVHGIPFEFHWGPGIYATLAVSVVATFFALRFGGRLDDVKVPAGSKHATSAKDQGETVH